MPLLLDFISNPAFRNYRMGVELVVITILAAMSMYYLMSESPRLWECSKAWDPCLRIHAIALMVLAFGCNVTALAWFMWLCFRAARQHKTSTNPSHTE